jgi:glycosyltransferase involved in cell wall biosynthesis
VAPAAHPGDGVSLVARRRVLIVSEPMEYGVLSYVERLCEGLDGLRWEPALAFSPSRMAPQARALVDRLVARGVRVRSLPFHRGVGPGDARAALGLIAEIRSFRPDVLHLHSTKAGLVGRTIAAMLRTPALYTPHGMSWHYTGPRLGRIQLALERMLRRLTTALVSVCPEEAAAFVGEVGFDPARVRVVPNGVGLPDRTGLRRARQDFRAWRGMAPGEVWLVVVARLTREKGVDVLLRALEADVGASGLLIVGTGSERAALEAQAKRMPLPVRFCGYQPDVSPFLAAADVFVQPSRSEGLPFAALEAMAHGLPVVGSRVGGMGSAIDGCGLLVPPEQPAVLGAALRTLCRDADARAALGEAARLRAARDFGEAAMLTALEATYEAACDRAVIRVGGPAGSPSRSTSARGAHAAS